MHLAEAGCNVVGDIDLMRWFYRTCTSGIAMIYREPHFKDEDRSLEDPDDCFDEIQTTSMRRHGLFRTLI